MEQLTKNQAVATSQEAVQNQNEPQLRDENAHNDKSVHGVLIQLTKLGYDATPFNQILKQNAKREMRLRLGKVTVADVLAAQPVTTNLLKFMRASIKMIGVSNLQSFIASMTQKLDRKSGSAGMPRPISYAVFCLKKKRAISMLRHGCHSRVRTKVGNTSKPFTRISLNTRTPAANR